MSATFKNAKKKLSQPELRRFMNDHKGKLQKTVKKIESPLAKYNEAGQLLCVLCKTVVKSEAIWPVHLNSKLHRDNVNEAKKLKETTNNFTVPTKRPLTPTIEPPIKKIKGILKNSTSKMIDNNNTNNEQISTVNNIPDEKMEIEVENTNITSDTILPEGFFDDPKQDAKARNVEYKDPIEEEWERFQKVIREADNESAAIIAEDQEEATNERQIDEIEEQMKNWSRVLTLEQKKTNIVSNIHDEVEDIADEDDSSLEEEEFDEYLDWRAKQSFK